MLRLRQHLHELFKGRVNMVRAQQRQREAGQQRGGRRKTRGRRQVRFDLRIDAARGMPALAHSLRRGLQVIRPVARGSAFQVRRPFEIALAVPARARSADSPVGAGAERDPDPPPDRHRQHRQAVIVDVLADQVDSPGHRDGIFENHSRSR
jgi:hypothetical protein